MISRPERNNLALILCHWSLEKGFLLFFLFWTLSIRSPSSKISNYDIGCKEICQNDKKMIWTIYSDFLILNIIKNVQIIVMKDLGWVFFSLWRCEDFKLIWFGMQRSQVLRCQMRNEIKAIQCMVAWLRKRVVVDSYCTWAKVSLIRLWPSSIYIWNSNRNKT